MAKVIEFSQDEKSSAGFQELAMPLFDSLYNVARWLVRNQSDAEDLVQETYRKGLHSFASFKPATTFRGWIFRILKNAFLSSRSGLERKMTVAIESEEDGSALAPVKETPETILIERSNRQLVQRAVDELPAHYRSATFVIQGASFVTAFSQFVERPPRFRMALAKLVDSIRQFLGHAIYVLIGVDGKLTQVFGRCEFVRVGHAGSADMLSLPLALPTRNTHSCPRGV